MKPLTQYGRLAEKHWREFCPNRVAEMEATGRLQEMLLEAEEKTEAEMDGLRRHLIQQGLTPQQAHDRAWEIVRERYLLIPPENKPREALQPSLSRFATKPTTASPSRTGSASAR